MTDAEISDRIDAIVRDDHDVCGELRDWCALIFGDGLTIGGHLSFRRRVRRQIRRRVAKRDFIRDELGYWPRLAHCEALSKASP